MIKPILLTSGEPAGIGPDIVIMLAQQRQTCPYVVIADPELLRQRAMQLSLPLTIKIITQWDQATLMSPGTLNVFPLALKEACGPGVVTKKNAAYVVQMLDIAITTASAQQVAAVITAPVHKAILNDAGYIFMGHTHYFAEKTYTSDVTMFFKSPRLQLALVTDHVPLAQVSQSITKNKLRTTIQHTYSALQYYGGIHFPRIAVCGLNPHAGEQGYLGDEEIHIIKPVIEEFIHKNYQVMGPFAADSLFIETQLNHYDAVISLYHDQGLPVLKHISFGQAANITLGLPFLRTSVDHGTALNLAGSGKATAASLQYVFDTTVEMIHYAASRA